MRGFCCRTKTSKWCSHCNWCPLPSSSPTSKGITPWTAALIKRTEIGGELWVYGHSPALPLCHSVLFDAHRSQIRLPVDSSLLYSSMKPSVTLCQSLSPSPTSQKHHMPDQSQQIEHIPKQGTHMYKHGICSSKTMSNIKCVLYGPPPLTVCKSRFILGDTSNSEHHQSTQRSKENTKPWAWTMSKDLEQHSCDLSTFLGTFRIHFFTKLVKLFILVTLHFSKVWEN